MKKRMAMLMVTAGLGLAAGAQTFTGIITDHLCDNGDHKSMHMASDAKCVAACVKSMGGKYALYDGKTSYILSDQKTPEKFAAAKVTVTGTLDPKTKTIKVDSIVAAK